MRLYLDTNILIEAVEGRTETSAQVAAVLSSVPASPPRLVTSELTLAEILVKPLQLGRLDLLDAYEALLKADDTIEVAPIDRYVLRGAAYLRARDRTLKLADALHLATASRTRCTHFLTNDKRIRRPFDYEMLLLDKDLKVVLEAFQLD